ncbi:uncharacterized protein [Primulina huaijiensis]|uniref:uncharacterized protein isoform X2 n=1 Tax=Primulina huaijiensis TaxID=1492673 RepID=UPI003CC78F5B
MKSSQILVDKHTVKVGISENWPVSSPLQVKTLYVSNNLPSTTPQPRDRTTWDVLFSPPHHGATGRAEFLRLFVSLVFLCHLVFCLPPIAAIKAQHKISLVCCSCPFFFQLLGGTSAALVYPFLELRPSSSNFSVLPLLRAFPPSCHWYGVTPFTPLKGLFISGPNFCSFFFAIRKLTKNVPSFK